MKVRLGGLLALCFAFALIASFKVSRNTYSQAKKTSSLNALSQAEQDLLNEINQARAHPQTYATYLEKLAITFLRASKPLGPLSPSQGLCFAALAHVKDQSGTGATGHKGADSTFIEQRVKPFGIWEGGIGENLTYGNESARERLLTWLIDDGFAGRGHRKRLMSADYRVAGVSCGPHPEFGAMCVLTLAGGFKELESTTPTAAPNNNTKVKAGTARRRHA